MILIAEILIVVEVGAQHQTTVCLRFQPKIHDLTPNQVVHNNLKQHVRHLLTVFIPTVLPDLSDLIYPLFHRICESLKALAYITRLAKRIAG